MKVAIFSDLHIGVHKNSTEWYKIALKWCSWFTQELENNQIDAIIFCGDYFHHRDTINVQTLNIGKKILDVISRDVPVYLLAGNHDCYYDDKSDVNSVSLWKNENVHVFDKLQTIRLDEQMFVFAPWGTNLQNLPEGDVLITHCELNNFKLNSGRISDCKLEASTLLDQIPLAFIGHIHLRAERVYKNNSKIIYVGNPFEMDFNDEGNLKGFYVYDTYTSDIQFIENTVSPKHHKVYTSNIIENNLSNIVNNSIIRIVVDKKIDDETFTKLKASIVALSPFQITDTDYIDKHENMQTDTGEYDISNSNIESMLVEFINKLDIQYKDEIKQKQLKLYQKYANA